MDFTVVIPARYASSRLPGKPLAMLAGKPMIVHVMQRCLASGAARVLVATDNEAIAMAVNKHGGESIFTRASHQSGTDRLQEVAATLGLADDAIIVNVQGDEPLIPSAVINQVAADLAINPGCAIATLCEPITDVDDVFNPNIVKVALNHQGEALYFSRAPLPYDRDHFSAAKRTLVAGHWWRHIGIYAYRVGLLHDFVRWPVAELEKLEALEQLRALYQGARIHVSPACEPVPGGVDTPADLERMSKLLKSD